MESTHSSRTHAAVSAGTGMARAVLSAGDCLTSAVRSAGFGTQLLGTQQGRSLLEHLASHLSVGLESFLDRAVEACGHRRECKGT